MEDRYDFHICKLCRKDSAAPLYRLKNTTIYCCCDCGFHYISHLDDLPSAQADYRPELDGAVTNFIEKKLIPNEKQLRKNLHFVRKFCTLPGSDCLDIGAGAGLFSSLIRVEGGNPYGIEPQAVFRSFAAMRFGIVLEGKAIEDCFWQDGFHGHFHVVTMWDVLEHVNFPVETVQGAYNVTRPGGWLFLDTPCRDGLFYRMGEWSYRLSGGTNGNLLQSLYSPLPYRHKQMFTRSQLVQMVKDIGYDVMGMIGSSFNKIIVACRKHDRT